MSLKRLELPFIPGPLDPPAERLVRDAEARIERFVHDRRDDPLPGFVPSDARLSYAVLAAIRDLTLAPELTFCEWGSGFGVTACLASQLGYEACGVEIEHDLVSQARDLATAHELPTEFAQGSFIPEGGDDFAVDSGEFHSLATGVASGYDELGLDADDFSVIYAYPWPGEEQTVERLFNRFAAVGALLVTYRGMDSIHVHRKVAPMTRRRRR